MYPSLDALPLTVDLVDVFRKNEDLPGVADEVVADGAGTLWFQLGLFDLTRPHRSRTTPGSTS